MVVEGMVAVVCVCACEQLGWLLHQARLVGLRRAGVVQGVRRRAVVRMGIPSGLSPHTSTRASGSRLRHTQFCWPRRYGIGLGFLCHAKVARRETRAKGRGLTARSEGRMDGGGLWDGPFPPFSLLQVPRTHALQTLLQHYSVATVTPGTDGSEHPHAGTHAGCRKPAAGVRSLWRSSRSLRLRRSPSAWTRTRRTTSTSTTTSPRCVLYAK